MFRHSRLVCSVRRWSPGCGDCNEWSRVLSGRIAALSPSRRSGVAAFAPSVPISRYLARSELCVGTESLMCFQRLAGGFLVGKQPLAVKLEPTGNLFRTTLGFFRLVWISCAADGLWGHCRAAVYAELVAVRKLTLNSFREQQPGLVLLQRWWCRLVELWCPALLLKKNWRTNNPTQSVSPPFKSEWKWMGLMVVSPASLFIDGNKLDPRELILSLMSSC